MLAVFPAVQPLRSAEPQMPEQAKVIHARLAPALKPAVREWVSAEAKKISRIPNASELTVKADIRTRFAGQPLGGGDVEALAFLVMMEATKEANEDLKAVMAETKSANEKKAAQRQAAAHAANSKLVVANIKVRPGVTAVKSADTTSAAKTDSLGEMSEEQQLRLQMAMDRRTKAMETLSNLLNKMSDTQSNIVSNLK